jgi:hypothetical protein
MELSLLLLFKIAKNENIKLRRSFIKEINLLLPATAFNLKKWMNIYCYTLFIQDFTLLQKATEQIKKLKSFIYS